MARLFAPELILTEQLLDSDSHNGGLKCFVKNGFIYKPRSLFAEERLFSPTSQLRKYLDQIFSKKLITLPYLDFADVKASPCLDYQKMSYFELESVTRTLTDDEIASVGATFALLNLLGVSDLHKTNILFGEKAGQVYFAPIDLEIIFQSFLFSALSFLPSEESHALCCSGSYHFIHYKSNFDDPDFTAKLIDGYIQGLNLLMRHKVEIYRLALESYDPTTLPIRVVLRPTNEYHFALQNKDFNSFTPEEREQLERGDIPFFFKFAASDDNVYYWKDETVFAPVRSTSHRVITIYPQSNLEFNTALQSFCLITSCLDSDLGDTPCVHQCGETKILHKKQRKLILTQFGTYSVPRHLFMKMQ